MWFERCSPELFKVKLGKFHAYAKVTWFRFRMFSEILLNISLPVLVLSKQLFVIGFQSEHYHPHMIMRMIMLRLEAYNVPTAGQVSTP